MDSQPSVAQLEEHGTITECLRYPKVAGSIPVPRKSFSLYPNWENQLFFFRLAARALVER
jgi:hypothetical protein